jgi:pyruvate kinase
VEHDPAYEQIIHAVRTPPQATGADAIAAAAHAVADTVKLSAIVCYTATGSTALRVARERPNLPVISLTPVQQTARRLSCVWGIQSYMSGDPADLADMVRRACRVAYDEGFVRAGGGILITAGVPLGSPGATNMIRIAFVDDKGNPAAENR